MGCATGSVKFLLFAFNLLFALCGLALVILGVVYAVSANNISSVVEDTGHPPIFAIVVGAVIFVISFFGCCGAIRENTCMLNTYASLLICLLILQIAIGAYIFINKDSESLKKSIRRGLEKALDQYGKNDEVTSNIDFIQSTWHCCGINGPQDHAARLHVPNSCCPGGHCNLSNILGGYTEGCYTKLTEVLQKAFHSIAYAAIALCAVELVGVIFSLCLASSIRNSARRGNF